MLNGKATEIAVKERFYRILTWCFINKERRASSILSNSRDEVVLSIVNTYNYK